MATVNQPTARPTNKTLAFLLATILTNIALRALQLVGVFDWLAADAGTPDDAAELISMVREAVFLLISAGIGYGAAWLQRDQGNQPVEVAELERAVRSAGGTIPPKPEGNTP